MTLQDYGKVEKAAGISRVEVGRIGLAVLFIGAVIIFVGERYGHIEQSYLLVVAAVVGAYMAGLRL